MPIAIGDIHGCVDPLEALVARLPPAEPLVFLGDYIDRGPDSARAIDYLQRLAKERPCRFLMGNHEEMLLRAIARDASVPSWLEHGGNATVRS